ncbi:furin-like protease 1 isoform X2 [Photinus pyralis]|nr:furin-like protease 1 isoform X2 [Photinus pyralis]
MYPRKITIAVRIFDDHYHFTHPGITKRSTPHLEKKIQLAADIRVKWAQQQIVKKRVKRDLRLQDSDPRWPSMWYLNRGNGLDMNVIPAWLEGVTGKGAVVTILDDGLEKDHPDLVKNYDPMASYDVNNHDSDPSPRYDMIDSNRHGTRCAGEVAATSNNSVCALGVAHGAQVGGVRMLDGDVTDAVEARSLSLNPQHIDIYSASWGPDDDGKTVDGPGELATRAFIEGVTKGRNGKGSIFVWASGNGGRDHDNCNCDGYTNSIYSLSISSATEQGHVPWYSEACSSTLASTYSSGAVGERQVVTTDLHHSCTSSHTGTSASAPLAAGICALALEANPNLTWRDMQHIVVRTARPHHLVTSDWQINGVGRNVSHSFGYGLMDAYAMVQLARKWVTVPEQHKCEITAPHVQKSIPAKSVVVLQLQVTECEGVQILEHVQAKLTIFSQRRGDLHIQLTSPMGTRVTLLAHRGHDIARSGFNHWPFMSVHSWGETPFGTWQLEIHNDGRMLGRATLQNWSLILYGTKIFFSASDNTDSDKPVKNKNANKKKPAKKPKNSKNILKLINPSPKPFKNLNRGKNKTFTSTTKDLDTTNMNVQFNKKKQFSNISLLTTTSPYFYSVNNTKFQSVGEGGKPYWKFIKNISITYPIMIPAREGIKSRDPFKKAQKQKEKSRDLNSNRNTKTFTSRPPEATTLIDVITSKDKALAEIETWDLILYGTSSPPKIDEDEKVNNKPGKTNIEVNEMDHNSLDLNPPNESWKSDAEIRKDTSVLEEFLPANAAQNCAKSNGQFCLECQVNYFMHNGRCYSECPEKFYASFLDELGAKKNMDKKMNVCLSCHYSCKRCSGSNDYQCTLCYPDAILMQVSSLEHYCYPNYVVTNTQLDKLYFKVYIFLWIMFGLFVIGVILYIIRERRLRNNLMNELTQLGMIKNIRQLERNIKASVYSDSE